MRFGIHRVPTSFLIYDFHQVLTVFTQPNVIPMQLYQGFWQLRAFNFFFTRVTSIKFRHFRINIGYDYFHISLFLIFVYFFFFYRNLPIYLSYFRFFSLNMKSIFCISIVSPPNVSNKRPSFLGDIFPQLFNDETPQSPQRGA